MYVVVARFYAQAGKEKEVEAVLRQMVPISNAEPGCIQYVVNRSVDDPRMFLLYEQYVDEAGFNAHLESAEFKQHVQGTVVPLLERREREIYDVVEGEPS